MVDDLNGEFATAADELTSGEHLENAAFWDTLEKGHFDLNTCLREAIVLLKSFLVVLPDEQVTAFEAAVNFRLDETPLPTLAFRHRRFVAVPGK
jgi:hypothetical protein